VPAAGEAAVLFLPANTARQLVGISVGIGSNLRSKSLQIQMIMEIDDCRPGAPEALRIATHGRSHSTHDGRACRAGFRRWAVISLAPVHPGMTDSSRLRIEGIVGWFIVDQPPST
jgi:hypothetical protein